jgi:hypothetical protein
MKHSTAQSGNPQIDFNRVWDVLVIGGGNAALVRNAAEQMRGQSQKWFQNPI